MQSPTPGTPDTSVRTSPHPRPAPRRRDRLAAVTVAAAFLLPTVALVAPAHGATTSPTTKRAASTASTAGVATARAQGGATGCGGAGGRTPAGTSLSVTPILTLEASAGDRIEQDLPVCVGGPIDGVVQLEHVDFGFKGADYERVMIPDDAKETTAFSTRNWFSTPRDRYRIRKNTPSTIPLTITVPDNTPGGTYLGIELMSLLPADAPTGTGAQAVVQTGPVIFITVAGGDPPKARIKRFEVPGLVSGGPITPKIQVEDVGDGWFAMLGEITRRGRGRDSTIEIGRQYVVPGIPRTLVRRKPGADPEHDEISLGPKHLSIGKHTVELRLRLEPTNTTLVARRTVWVIPTWLRIAGVVAALAVIGLLALLVAGIARWWRYRRYLGEELAAGRRDDREDADDRSDDADA